MNNKFLRNIIREELVSAINEEEIETSPFTPAEQKFLAKFAELGTRSLGIIYAPNEIGIREFLGRSGKELNLTPDVLSRLLKDNIISIVPYGGYSRNEDYTITCNIPIDDLEGLSSGAEEGGETGGETPPAEGETPLPPGDTGAGDEIPAGPPEESARSTMDLSKLLVAEQKKKKKHTKSRIHTNKARTLGRLPKGYVLYLEKIFEILGRKLHTAIEKEHMVADLLDNLAHNFGLTPKQVYKSYIYYKTQNRLQNIMKEK
jgi:hypothetical protein